MGGSDENPAPLKNNDLIASLVQFQKNAGRRLKKTNFEAFPTPTPISKANSLKPPDLKSQKRLPPPVLSVESEGSKLLVDENQNGDSRPAVANRVALFEKQKKVDTR
jgi:hypothetical protein